VPTYLSLPREIVGTAQARFCPPYGNRSWVNILDSGFSEDRIMPLFCPTAQIHAFTGIKTPYARATWLLCMGLFSHF